MAGFAPGAKFVKQEKGLASLAGRNQWADLVDDEEEEEEEAGAGASAAPTSVAAKPSAPAPAPPAVAAPDLEGPAAEGLIRPLPGAKVLETDAAVRAAVERICAVSKLPFCPPCLSCLPACHTALLYRCPVVPFHAEPEHFHAGATLISWRFY